MSPKLRRLSGAVSQRGSHIKLQRLAGGGARQTLTIPAHDELDTGTIRAILRQASAYVSENDLRPHFYTD